jgi:ferredoxin--NADP+ reductase
MVDGTGMCGGCRVSVGQENKFACVDGPEFDAHKVDFESLMARQRMYKPHEKQHSEHFAGKKEGGCKCHSH